MSCVLLLPCCPCCICKGLLHSVPSTGNFHCTSLCKQHSVWFPVVPSSGRYMSSSWSDLLDRLLHTYIMLGHQAMCVVQRSPRLGFEAADAETAVAILKSWSCFSACSNRPGKPSSQPHDASQRVYTRYVGPACCLL